jgi:hypothetical protein
VADLCASPASPQAIRMIALVECERQYAGPDLSVFAVLFCFQSPRAFTYMNSVCTWVLDAEPEPA